MNEMLEWIIVGVVVLVCAGLTFSGSQRTSGRTRITRPTKETATGMGGARAMDFSYVDRTGKGFPVGLKRGRTERRSFKEPRRKGE